MNEGRGSNECIKTPYYYGLIWSDLVSEWCLEGTLAQASPHTYRPAAWLPWNRWQSHLGRILRSCTWGVMHHNHPKKKKKIKNQKRRRTQIESRAVDQNQNPPRHIVLCCGVGCSYTLRFCTLATLPAPKLVRTNSVGLLQIRLQ